VRDQSTEERNMIHHDLIDSTEKSNPKLNIGIQQKTNRSFRQYKNLTFLFIRKSLQDTLK